MQLTLNQSPLKLGITIGNSQQIALITNKTIATKLDFPMVGLNGLSAYELAVIDGFVGTLQQWRESLIGGGLTTLNWTATQW